VNKKERAQVLEILERLTKLETTLILELKHIREDLKELNKHVGRLNEDYGKLSMKLVDLEKRQETLKNDYETQVKLWKFVAGLVSPIVTYCLIKIIEWLVAL